MTDKTTQDTSTEASTEAPVQKFEKGTWQADLQRSAALFDRSGNDRKRASNLLWTGAQEAITEWSPDSDHDVNAEVLYGDVLAILGTPRKGDASKIKTVALAVRNHGLILSTHANLSKAYAEATRLTKTVKQDKADDVAADKAIEALEAPNSASTPENAAKIVLSKGLDEAARLLLDALGATNSAAHRALVRAITAEVAGRVTPKVSTAKAGPKAGATQAKTGGAGSSPKAQVKTAGTKAKPAKATKATPVTATKATPGKSATPVKHNQAKATPVKKAAPVKTTATNPVQAAEKADSAAALFPDTKPTPVAVKRA